MSTVTLPDPQMMADAQSLPLFASAVSQSASKLINGLDPASPEFAEIKAYFKDNLSKSRAIQDHVEAYIG